MSRSVPGTMPTTLRAGMRVSANEMSRRAFFPTVPTLADAGDVPSKRVATDVVMLIRVGPGGEVQSVTAVPAGNLPGSVVGCVKARASAAQFSPPEGGSAVVVVPVTFVKQ